MKHTDKFPVPTEREWAYYNIGARHAAIGAPYITGPRRGSWIADPGRNPAQVKP